MGTANKKTTKATPASDPGPANQVRAALEGTPQPFAAAVLRLLPLSKAWAVSGPGRSADTWRPEAAHVIVASSLESSGTVVIHTGKHDYGVVLVLGDVRCRNLVVGSGFTLACTGSLHVDEVLSASAADSVTYVGGQAHAFLVDSGSPAWLTLFAADALVASHVTSYVMIGSKPLRSKKPRADLSQLLVDEAVDRSEWDSMDDEDREGEDPTQYIYLSKESRRLLTAGKSILRSPH